MVGLARRSLLSGAAATLAAARLALPGGAYAQGAGPETTAAQLGFIALTDAAPLIVAKERGLFVKHGMPDVEILRQVSWGDTCDNLVLGSDVGGIDGAHLLTPLAYLISMSRTGRPGGGAPMHILARLNTNGQAISVSNALKASGARLDATSLQAALAGKADNRVGMTFRGGTHDLWLRYWLAAAGINPDKDVETVAVAPSKMVANMRVSAMAAFCVGEPWPDQAVHENLGYTACMTSEIWRDHPEKSLVMRARWVAEHPRAAVALTAAVIEAQQWADRMDNKEELAAMLGKRIWLNVPPADIGPRLAGNIDYGDGRKVQGSPLRMKFWADAASYPFPSHDLWFLTEDIRWGVLPPDTDTGAAIAAVKRQDLWRLAAAEAGVAAADIPLGTSRGKETFFDGHVFDPEAPAEYLAGLKIKKVVA
jgi:nitrate/nitrite transport system substrate-binding protein